MIVKLETANDNKHKYVATFTNGRKTKFGQYGASDYTINKDVKRRELYRARHKKDLETNDPYKAGYLSYYLLWGKSTSLAQNVRDYNSRFF